MAQLLAAARLPFLTRVAAALPRPAPQEVGGATTYWLRVNMTCVREDGEDSVDFEAAAVEAPDGAVQVRVNAAEHAAMWEGSWFGGCCLCVHAFCVSGGGG